jgi:hypothetical protein
VKKRTGFHIASVSIFLLLVSCSLTKRTGISDEMYTGLNQKKFAKLLRINEAHDFNTLEISKFSAAYSGSEEKKNFKGYIRLKYDSVFMVSISPLMGIELFRIKVKPDSAGYIDRYNKTYYYDALSGLMRNYNLPADFSLIQSFLLGYDKFKDDPEIIPRSFRETKDFYAVEYFIPGEKSNFGIEYFYGKNLKIKRILLTDFSGGSSLDLKYTAYFDEKAVSYIPKELAISLINGNTIDKLELVYKSAELNKTLNFPFSISDKYTRVNYK